MIPKYLKSHSQFTSEDYEYLSTKGYSNKEILNLWNRDQKERISPVTVNKYKIDWSIEAKLALYNSLRN